MTDSLRPVFVVVVLYVIGLAAVSCPEQTRPGDRPTGSTPVLQPVPDHPKTGARVPQRYDGEGRVLADLIPGRLPPREAVPVFGGVSGNGPGTSPEPCCHPGRPRPTGDWGCAPE